MADVIIRDMEMPPKGEYRMTLYVCNDGYAYFDVDTFPVDEDRFEAVPLPAGHGRLIDADALASKMEKQVTERDKIMELCKRVGDTENYFRCSNNQTEIVSFVRMLNNAPTIVPAEGWNADG